MRNVGQTSHISVSTSQHAHWFTFFCSIHCTHSLIGCPMGEEVKELKALLVFAPEQVLQELECTRLDLARVHSSHPA